MQSDGPEVGVTHPSLPAPGLMDSKSEFALLNHLWKKAGGFQRLALGHRRLARDGGGPGSLTVNELSNVQFSSPSKKKKKQQVELVLIVYFNPVGTKYCHFIM